MFWVTDNFLMYRDPSKRRRNSSEVGLLEKAKVKYRNLRKKKSGSESDILLSGKSFVDLNVIKSNLIASLADDELLDPEHVPIITRGAIQT